MTTTTTDTLTAANLAGVEWITATGPNTGLIGFALHGFGVQRNDGAWLSFDGERPYNVTRKAAQEVADTIRVDDSLYWLIPA
ncbi:hypothetical protein [Gordonia sp. (in: high G+C Gram-positive bacteria)]|uniref:hypothetical protein n=1 Tax=Gordonia sp. (in: high G+C Gram-positive bacteria) TaxID=84139 RepID=UPI002606E888|nr:hypothetical protein [Gordonia sp. (in: high G+C Gram-positive bacteria)]